MRNLVLKTVIYTFMSLLWLFSAPLTMAASLQDLELLTEEYPPYNYINHNGEADGVSVRMLKEAYGQLGLVLDTSKIKTQPWPRAYRAAMTAENIMLFSTNRTEKREHLFQWAGPITAVKNVLLARKDHYIEIQNEHDIKKYLVGGIRDDVALQLVRNIVYDQGNLLTTPYAKSLVGMLALGRIDLWAYSEYTAKLLLSDHGFDPNDYEVVYTLNKSHAYYALSLDVPIETVAQLQRGIDKVRACSVCLERVFNQK